METINFVMIIILTCAVIYLFVVLRHTVECSVLLVKCVIATSSNTDYKFIANSDLEEITRLVEGLNEQSTTRKSS